MSANQTFIRENAKNYEDLSKVYLEIIKMIMPGRSLRWGNDKNIYKCISPELIKVNLQKLTNIEEKLKEKPDLSISDKALLQSILQRKFEFVEMECWKTSPYFYLERYIADFIDYIRKEKKEKNVSFYKESTDYLQSLVEIMLKHLEIEKMSTLDMKFTLYQLSNLISLVKMDKNDELSLIVDALNHLKEKFKQIVDNVPQFIRPLGYLSLSKLITLNSGISMNLLELKKQCMDYLSVKKQSFTKLLPNQFELDKSLIKDYLGEIHIAFNGYDSDIPFNIKNVPIIFTDTNHRIYYQMKNVLTDKESKLVISNKFYQSAERLKLDLVHEIYPGHHYERTTYYDFCQEDVALKTYENIVFIEGWAQVAQDRYCDIINDPLTWAYNSEDKRAIYIKGICTLLVHDEDMTWEECINSLHALIGIERKIIVSMLIEAYLEPLDNIAPLIGYLSLKNVSKNNLGQLIYNTNLFSLWGCKLNE